MNGDLMTGRPRRPGRPGRRGGWFSMSRGAARGRRRWGARDVMTVVTMLAVVATVLFVMFRPPVTPADGQTLDSSRPGERVERSTGALSQTDRKLIVGVRQAGLWEGPVGQQAQQRAGSPKIREVGNNLAREHMVLDEDVRQVAAQLKVVVPSQPNDLQKQWMNELSQLDGEQFDRRFVHLLRVAHGKVFGLIALVRSSTENSVVRAFAERCLKTVQRHMTYLESTGMADFPKINKEVA